MITIADVAWRDSSRLCRRHGEARLNTSCVLITPPVVARAMINDMISALPTARTAQLFRFRYREFLGDRRCVARR